MGFVERVELYLAPSTRVAGSVCGRIVSQKTPIPVLTYPTLHDVALVFFLVVQRQVLRRVEVLVLVGPDQRDTFASDDGLLHFQTFVFSTRTPRPIAHENLDVDVELVENGFVSAWGFGSRNDCYTLQRVDQLKETNIVGQGRGRPGVLTASALRKSFGDGRNLRGSGTSAFFVGIWRVNFHRDTTQFQTRYQSAIG